MIKRHRAPWECVYAKEDTNECRPGEKPKSDQEYFEILCLCILQAGLNWGVIRGKWQRYRRGFHRFSIDRLARTAPTKLLRNPDVLRNDKKVAAIIHNAQEFQKIKSEYGSIDDLLSSPDTLTHDELVELLTKRLRHVGIYTAVYYLHSVGYGASSSNKA